MIPGPLMSLAPGTRLGPYEILAPLGAGGMGEVYCAKDTRLGREVAIKVLPTELADDPQRLARFEREAQAVSVLNHPHIVTLYEVGTSEAGPYLVLEKIEGHSLRELLRAGPVPIRRILGLGAQIAQGLAKAHAAGIVHRDLKPENVMVSADGFAKILDFGLAKLVWPELDANAIEATTTLARGTVSGMILGTLGYLSPEQAAGKPADYRADQFALGALLYEMAARERPFHRDSVLESLTATIREEPEPLRSKRADLPPQLGWLVERCLAKDPNDRYASTRDLARDLADLRDHLSDLTQVQPSEAPPGGAPFHSRKWIAWTFASIALAAVAVGSFVTARQTAPDLASPSYRPLTFRRGVITGARFSPDGKTVYYSFAFGAEPSRVFVTHLERTESEPLALPPAFLLSVSAKDELAVLLTNERNAYNSQGTLARMPAVGGTPHPLIDNVTYADWAPDGERLAVIRGDDSQLEFPIGHSLPGSWSMVRVSPVADRLALIGEKGVEIHDGEGRPLAADDISLVYGIAWSPDGREVWFTGSESGSAHDRALYALSLKGKRRLIVRVPGAMTVFDVAQDRKSALVATGAGWHGISGGHVGQLQETPLDLLGRSQVVGLSADGKWLLANESREVGSGVYLRSTDGTRAVHLTDDTGIGLSADGAWALVRPRGNLSRLTLMPTGAGLPRELPLDSKLEISPSSPARWSVDGRRLFVELRPVGGDDRSTRVYVRVGDRPWQAVTPEGTAEVFAVSSNGQMVAAREGSGSVALFPIDGGAPRRLEGERGYPVHWSADGRLLYLAGPEQFPARIYRRDLVTGHVEPWRDIGPADPTGVIAVQRVLFASDGQSYVYQYSRGLNELYLAQGLR
jgi:serine/threonine protein kinase